MTPLFVFGTLKRGFPLHDRGLRQAQLLGLYRTVAPYPMLVAGPWFAPMLLNQPGTGRQVKGELYEIETARLALLDALESIGQPGNLRVIVAVEPLAGGAARSAWVYMKISALASPVHTAYLEDYQDRRFIPFEQRMEAGL
jgi:gamma-glutamylaminecyclotransferase